MQELIKALFILHLFAAEEETEEPKEEKNPNTSAKEVLLVLFGLTTSILLLHTVNKKYIR